MARKVRLPPLAGDEAGFHLWAQQLTDIANQLPPFSNFSLSTPESNITADPGTYGFNEASGVSVVWVKQSGFGNSGWTSIA